MDKQIEEMVITAYPIYATMEDSLRKEAIECMNSYTVFERLINAGYRKIPEGSVVIPKEISCYDDIEKLVKVYKTDLGTKVEFTDEQVMFLAQFYHFDQHKTRKQGFKEGVQALQIRLLNKLQTDYINCSREKAIAKIDEICKELTEEL